MDIIIIVFLGIACCITILMYYENKHLTISEYDIISKKVPSEFGETTFVLLSDLHNNNYGKDNHQLIHKINQIGPDYILIAGDMLVGKVGTTAVIATRLIKELSKKYPIYYGNGNHEQRLNLYQETKDTMYAEYLDHLNEFGVHLLVNKREHIQRKKDKIIITGLQIHEDYFKKVNRPTMSKEYLDHLLGDCQRDKFNLLIAHNPMYFKEYMEWGADLVVSGHVHGGMVRVPFLGGVVSPQYQLFPKYDAGLYHENNKYMVLSRGLGTHTIKMRLNNKPELVVIHLKRENE